MPATFACTSWPQTWLCDLPSRVHPAGSHYLTKWLWKVSSAVQESSARLHQIDGRSAAGPRVHPDTPRKTELVRLGLCAGAEKWVMPSIVVMLENARDFQGCLVP
jgi:hypothetical protein